VTRVDTQPSAAGQSGSVPLTPPVRATVFVSRWPDIPVIEVPGFPNGTFSPTTATLVTGATEAVLIDALYLKDDVRDLGDLIERTGKKLTTIYITHAHQDHSAVSGSRCCSTRPLATSSPNSLPGLCTGHPRQLRGNEWCPGRRPAE